MRMDPSGMYMVCSHSDRCMRIFDFMTGELSAQASGHAEVITGVTFLPDCRRLISVSSSSYMWMNLCAPNSIASNNIIGHKGCHLICEVENTNKLRSS